MNWEKKYGKNKRRIAKSNAKYMFSGWFGLKVVEPPIDRSAHIKHIIERLKPNKNKLIAFKEKYHAIYEIETTIYEGGDADIFINSEEISFLKDVGIELRITTFLMK